MKRTPKTYEEARALASWWREELPAPEPTPIINQETEPRIDRFKEIYKVLKKDVAQLEMGHWEYSGADQFTDEFRNPVTGQYEYRGCGTTRCVAGWALHHVNPTKPFDDVEDDLYEQWGMADLDLDGESYTVAIGASILGLEYEDAHTLFINSGNAKALRFVKLMAKGKVKKALKYLRETDSSGRAVTR